MTCVISSPRTIRAVLLAAVAALAFPTRAQTASTYPMIDLGLLANGARTIPTDLGEGGHVVGYAWTSFQDHAFLWNDYRIEDLGTLGGLYSYAAKVNARGEVVGWANVGSGVLFHAFYRGASGLVDIGLTGEWQSYAVAIDDGGRVLLNSYRSPGRSRAYLWHDGVSTDLGTLGGEDAAGWAMNERGQVVATAADASGAVHAFIWQDGSIRVLPDPPVGALEPRAVNDAGVVAGQMRRAEDGWIRGFVWDGGELIDLGTFGGDTVVTDIGPAGHVVGFSRTPSGAEHAFVWKDGVMTDLGTLGGCCSSASAVNGAGQVVGVASLAPGSGTHAFLWQDGVMADLGVLGVPPAPYDVYQYSVAIDVNEAGDIVGYGYPESGDLHGILWTARSAPELLVELASDIARLDLRNGTATSLAATLQGATALAERGEFEAACHALRAFRNAVAAQYEKALGWDQADALQRRAGVVEQALRCTTR